MQDSLRSQEENERLRSDYEILQEECASLRAECVHLKDTLSKMHETVASMHGELEGATVRNKEVIEENQSLRQTVTTRRRDLEVLAQRISELQVCVCVRENGLNTQTHFCLDSSVRMPVYDGFQIRP